MPQALHQSWYTVWVNSFFFFPAVFVLAGTGVALIFFSGFFFCGMGVVAIRVVVSGIGPFLQRCC